VNPTLRGSAAHLFVDDLRTPELSADDAHHVGRVLRVRPGEEVTLSDGRGSWVAARWTAAGPPEVVGDPVLEPGPRTPATVAVSVPKRDRPELVVQKLTEIGVDRILLFEASRSVVRWDGEAAQRHLARLHRVAREAAMQSRRVRLPVVARATWSELLSEEAAAIAEPGGQPPPSGLRAVVVGPEGGFTEAELADARASGLPPVSLGPTVLRVETAAIVAATIVVRAD